MDDGMSFEDQIRAPWNQWYPPPLVMGDRVYSWMSWEVKLVQAVEVPGDVQLVFERGDGGPEFVFREPNLHGRTRDFLREGAIYGIIGLGDRMVEQNMYYFESIYGSINGCMHTEILTQGILGWAINEMKGSSFSRLEKERRRKYFNYFRELYFWTCLRGFVFKSEAEKQQAVLDFRRQANDNAVGACRVFLRFNGKKYVDYSLPLLEPPRGGTRRT